MQSTIVAGETLNYRATVSEYSAVDGWSATLYLNPRAGGAVITVVSTADAEAHLVQASATTTAAWVPGNYAWELWANRSGERYRIDSGQLEVQPSLIGAAAGLDTRTTAQRVLDELQAAYEAHIASGSVHVASYTINGRATTYRSLAELLGAINAARRDVANEEAAARVAQGLPGRTHYVVRM